MSSVDDEDVCDTCGKTYWYSFDCKTGKRTKTTKCDCDKKKDYADELEKQVAALQKKIRALEKGPKDTIHFEITPQGMQKVMRRFGHKKTVAECRAYIQDNWAEIENAMDDAATEWVKDNLED